MEDISFYVCLPFYNSPEYINEAIESVLRQRYGQYHLILVDDGSIDNSRAICNQYVAKYSYVHLITQENQGPFVARLTAINKAKELSSGKDETPFVIFLDADDELAPNAFDTIVQAVKETPGTDTVIFGYDRMDTSGMTYHDKGVFHSGVVENKNELMCIIISKKYDTLWTKATRLDLFDDISLEFNNSLRIGEDGVLTMALLNKSRKAVFITDRLYYYRENPSSTVHTIHFSKVMEDYSPKFNFIYNMLVEEGCSDECIAEFIDQQVMFLPSYMFNVFRDKGASLRDKKQTISLVHDISFIDRIFAHDKHRLRIWIIKLFYNGHYLIGGGCYFNHQESVCHQAEDCSVYGRCFKKELIGPLSPFPSERIELDHTYTHSRLPKFLFVCLLVMDDQDARASLDYVLEKSVLADKPGVWKWAM